MEGVTRPDRAGNAEGDAASKDNESKSTKRDERGVSGESGRSDIGFLTVAFKAFRLRRHEEAGDEINLPAFRHGPLDGAACAVHENETTAALPVPLLKVHCDP